MRLIATFEQEKEAFAFSSLLKNKEIANSYELQTDPQTEGTVFRVWVVNEEDVETAELWLNKFKENPEDPEFLQREGGSPSPNEGLNIRVDLQPKIRSRFTLTNFLIALCGLFFFWNAGQEAQIAQKQGDLAVQIELTPLQQELFFDYPYSFQKLQELIGDASFKDYKEIKDLPPDLKKDLDKVDEIPYWKGLTDVIMDWKATGWTYLHNVPMFEKIRQGEIWRLFTPCLLHRDILHILFNMAWLFILGRQIEERLKKWRMILMIVMIGAVSNIAQYLMGGPFFLGFSGVVVGMVGYIWMRKRVAPWEGYPLHPSIIIFVFIFVAAMFGLEFISLGLQWLHVTKQSANIANTAHIIGGLIGMWLGKLSLFSRRKVA